MTEQEIEQYIANQLKAGVDQNLLKSALESEGIDPKVIEKCIQDVKTGDRFTEKLIAPEPKSSQPAFLAKSAEEETGNKVEMPEPPPQAAVESEADKGDLKVIGKKLITIGNREIKLPAWLERPAAILLNKFVLVGLGAAVIVGGMGIYAALAFRMTPGKIQDKFVEKLGTLNAAGFDLDILAEVDPAYLKDHPNQTFDKIDIKAKGHYDYSDSNNPELQATFSSTGDGFSISGEFRLVNRIAYAKLDEFPYFGSEVKGKWYRLSPKEVDLGKASKSGWNLKLFGDDALTLTKLPDETINGVPAYHLSYEISPTAIKKLFDDLNAEYYKNRKNPAPKSSSPKDCDSLDCLAQGNYNMPPSEIGKLFGLKPGEIWIGKKNFYQVKNVQGIDLFYRGTKTGTITFTGNWSDFNKTANIEAPYPFEDLSDLFKLKLPVY